MRPAVHRWAFYSRVWILTAAVRLALWVLPFARLRVLVRQLGRQVTVRQGAGKVHPDEVARAVLYATRFVPRASCLTQALATHVLLSRAGHEPRLRIGLTHDRRGRLQAHAWVENMGEVAIGGRELHRFVPLPALEQK